MESFDELLRQAEAAHGHMCAGQILGVRMALLGLESLGIADPRGADRKRIVTFVEIDRCATDAIGLVTGCRLGKRSLKFRDWGKMAATLSIFPTAKAFALLPARMRESLRPASIRISRPKSRSRCRPTESCRPKSFFFRNGSVWISIRPTCREQSRSE